MGKLRQLWIGFTGLLSWSSAKRQARLMSKFAATERGSSYDMLAALEKTQYRELRLKYLHHALDEARHARLFRERALSLGVDRELAALVDIGYLTEQGIIGEETLIERFGEIEFLAFVHDAIRVPHRALTLLFAGAPRTLVCVPMRSLVHAITLLQPVTPVALVHISIRSLELAAPVHLPKPVPLAFVYKFNAHVDLV